VRPLDIVDSHVHLWNLLHPELRWNWLSPEAVHPIIGDINGVKATSYEARSLWAEARFAGVKSFVHVQSAVGSPDPVEETRWLTNMSADGGIPAALIAHANLSSPGFEAVLDSHAESPLFRGIRDLGAQNYIASGEVDEEYERGFRSLARRHLIFELGCTWQQLAGAADLARRHRGVQFVLEHFGHLGSRDSSDYGEWRKAIDAISSTENVVCKISGVSIMEPLFTQPASLAPWFDGCVEAFTSARCMVGSNWPLYRLFSSYDVIMDSYRSLASHLSVSEQVAILSGTAERIYRL
jgi:predicted TIM-barrel fold metal-dependent hydrolase